MLGDVVAELAIRPSVTERQAAILRLFSEGLRSPEIGAELHISPRTVKTHASAILRRMRVRTMNQAVAVAVREGLIP